jgi:hypothetical protein
MTTTLSLADATQAYARNSTPHRLLAPFSRAVFTATGGRYGRLRITARRLARLVRSALQLGAAEAAGLDQYSSRTHPATGALTAQFGTTFEHAIRADYTPMRSRVRNAAITARIRPPLTAFTWLLLVGIVVFTIDQIFSEPLVSRLADVHPIAVHIASGGIAFLFVLIGHLAVNHTPPGQISHVRNRLIATAIAALAVFVGLGGFLRVHAANATNATTPGLNGADPDTWAALWAGLWPVLVGWGSMVGLMILTLALSGLASLTILSLTHRLRPDGPEVARRLNTAGHFDHGLTYLIDHAHTLSADLIHANHVGYTTTAHPDLADRTRPHPIPNREYQPALTD